VIGGVSLRPAEERDLDGLVRLEQKAFSTDRMERRAFRYALRSPTISMLVAANASGTLGYIHVQRRCNSRIAHLTSIAVSPEASGKGLGRSLVEAAERDAQKHGCNRMRLEVRADNQLARGLYEGLGYRLFTTAADYYEDGEAALRFEKALAPAAIG
jgi:ribosomal-protein-alanine acetyltransferase